MSFNVHSCISDAHSDFSAVASRETADVNCCMFVRLPGMKTPTGTVCGSNASMRYIANAHAEAELYGRSLAERAEVDSVLDAIVSELETPFMAGFKGADAKQVVSDITRFVEKMEARLTTQTFLVGERMSICDIAVSAVLIACNSNKTINLGSYPACARLINTVSGRCEWNDSISASAKPAAKQQAPKKEAPKEQTPKEEAPKKEAAKKEEAPVEEVKPAAPKVKDPIDELPPTDFDMEAWKRYYSNSKDLKGDAMPWLWNHFDKEGWSFYHVKYTRYNEKDNTAKLMACNMLGMFLQRMDNALRKYTFAVGNVFQEDGFFDIECVFFWRGHDVPMKLVDHDQFESFVWTKLDAEKDKKIIEDYFCEGDAINGRTIVDCKVYK